MFATQGIPQVTVQELAERLGSDSTLIVLDIREPNEIPRADLAHEAVVYVPMSQLAQQQLQALPAAWRNHPDTELVVMCHHGVRSMRVTAWLQQLGWKNAHNLTGGIDAYARYVDPSVGSY